MALSRALESLPGDRSTQQAVREILLCLTRHEGEPMTVSRVAGAAGVSRDTSDRVIAALRDSHVVRPAEEDDAVVYEPDRVVRLDVDRFVRRVESRTGKLQDNVGRFRERYGR